MQVFFQNMIVYSVLIHNQMGATLTTLGNCFHYHFKPHTLFSPTK